MLARIRDPAALAFFALGLFWGLNFVFMKWASETISPAQITFLRVLFGFLPVLGFAVARRAISRAHLRHAHHFFVMSVLATSIYYFAFASGTAILPSGIAGALSGAVPLFAFVGTAAFLRSEPIRPLQAIGIAVGFGGILVIARPWDATGAVDATGVLFMLAGSASVGLSFVYARRFMGGLSVHPAALTTYQMGFGLVTLALVTDFSGIDAILGDPRATVAMVVGLGLLGTGVAYILYYMIVGSLGALAASSVTYIPPVVALAVGWVLVGEALLVLDLVAVALILTGITMVRIRRS